MAEVNDGIDEGGEGEGGMEGEEDLEILEMRRQVEELERETQELASSPSTGATGANGAPGAFQSSRTYSPAGAAAASAPAVDENSIHVGNLHESTVPDDLQNHFKACGTIKRITIICDKWTGKPKGYAYIEFMEPKAVELALGFHESSLKGNMISVTLKRQNVPSFILRGRGRGGGGFRGAPRGRGGYRGGPPRGGFRGRFAPY
jgi:polyadenylate-binding protein 2